MTREEYADQCTDEPADRTCVVCGDDATWGKRCKECERRAREDVLLAVLKLHDPEDMGVAEQHPDVVAARKALEPFDREDRLKIESALYESLTRRMMSDVDAVQRGAA
jgi:hypothetical protein